MSIPEIIARKRDGYEHTREELTTIVLGFTRGQVPDYQVAAWLMAVFLRGLSGEETLWLTEILASSGEQLDLSSLSDTVDKHSTGGVGDKTTLVLAPILAACGLTVAKMSGRGLAHTGGTIDKLESIPGWQAELDDERFIAQARELGLVIVGQSKALAPADGLLYALRDVTATAPSVPLIASSVMSKKLAAGAHIIMLDVKVGRGAFMQTLDEARLLARLMLEIGQRAGRKTRVCITDMNAPLGQMAGNALEVLEAIETLAGRGAQDLRELCLEFAREALLAAGRDEVEAKERPQEVLDSGQALARFRAFVQAQGGDLAVVDDPSKLEIAPGVFEIRSTQSGFVTQLDALAVGKAVLALGGGRSRKGAVIDHGVGVSWAVKPGDSVSRGELLARLYHRDQLGLELAKDLVVNAFTIKDQREVPPPLIYEQLS